MKGMQRIKRHKSFVNVVKYVLKPGSHHKSDPVVIGGNMTSDCANEMIAEFNTASSLRTDIAKPAWHNSLRLPKNDELTNEQWKLIANDYMTQLGFSDTHLRCYVLHDDSMGQHIHIIANRVDAVSGKVHLGRHESLVSGRIIQELEIAHGLTQTPAVRVQPKQTMRKLSRNEEMLSQRTGLPCPKKSLQQIIDKCLKDKPNLETFIKRIREAQVSWTANVSKTGKMNGFSFEYQNIAFKASQLGKMYSWANLQKLLNYEPERDNPLLLNAKPVAPAPAPAPATILRTTERRESIGGKIAELELRLREDKRTAIVEKILLKNTVKQQKHLRLSSWFLFLQRLIELLRSYGKSILHNNPARFSKVYATQHLSRKRKIRL
ncbi:relaxase/mobilization nuclease domain-containing protein [Salmonella enterica]